MPADKGSVQTTLPTIRKTFPILGVAIFCSMLGAGIIAPLLPIYAEDLGASDLWIGVIFAGFTISHAIFMPIFGAISDRTGRKTFICVGLFAFAVVSLGYVWANSIAEMVFVRLIHGFASAMIIPVAQAYVGELSPQGEEGNWMGYFNAAYVAGYGFGPLLGGVLADAFGMDVGFYVMATLSLLAFILALSLLPEVRQRRETTNPLLALTVIRQSNMMKGLFGFRLLYALGRAAFTAFIPAFGALYLGLTSGRIGIVQAIYMLLLSASMMFSGKIADIFSRKGLAIIGSLISVAFLASIPEMGNFWQLLGLCIFGGLGGALVMPASSALAVEEGKTYGMGAAMGVFNMAMSLGMVAGPILGGVVADSFNVDSAFYLGAGAGLLSIGLLAWFTK